MVGGKLVLLLILIAIPLVSADPISELSDEESKARLETSNFQNIDFVVVGKYASRIELFALDRLEERNPVLKSKPHVSDDENSTGNLLLVGGPWQNQLTSNSIDDNSFLRESINISAGHVDYFRKDSRIIISFSDRQGFSNLPRTNVYNSPLGKFIPFSLIPFVAAFIAFTLLWFGKFFGDLFNDILNNSFSKGILKFLKKKELQNEFKGFRIFKLRVKYREWSVIMISAVVFALAISYTYYLSIPAMFLIIVLNLLVNVFLYAFKNFIRLLMDAKFELHTEYSLWPFGAFVTLLSGFLGNTFGVAGYTISDKSDRPIQGLAEFLSTAALFLLSLVFLYLNLTSPSVFNQMVFASSLTGAFLSMLPIFPFEGKKIYSWSGSSWWILFIPITIVYVLMTLLLW